MRRFSNRKGIVAPLRPIQTIPLIGLVKYCLERQHEQWCIEKGGGNGSEQGTFETTMCCFGDDRSFLDTQHCSPRIVDFDQCPAEILMRLHQSGNPFGTFLVTSVNCRLMPD